MDKQKFLYDFLTAYNKKESELKREFNTYPVSEAWENFDKKHSTSGLIFNALRNLLVHNTLDTISYLENSTYKFDWILERIETLSLISSERTNFIEFLITSSNIEQELVEKEFSLFVSDNNKNYYRCFSKQTAEGLRANIFFHHSSKFISFDVSTYNHNVARGQREYYKNTKLYIESELYKGNIGCHIFLNNGDKIPPKLDIVFELRNKKRSNFLEEINWIAIAVLENGFTKTYSNNSDSDTLTESDLLLSKIDKIFNIKTINFICSDVNSLYGKTKGIIRKIGYYN